MNELLEKLTALTIAIQAQADATMELAESNRELIEAMGEADDDVPLAVDRYMNGEPIHG